MAWNLKKALATNEDSYYVSLNDLGYVFSKMHDFKPEKKHEIKPDDQTTPPCEEVPILIFKRWKKLESDFYKTKEGRFDISKVPDIYYSVRYDLLHSRKMVEANKELCAELLECSQKLAHFVIPAEYGLTDQERVDTSLHVRNYKSIQNNNTEIDCEKPLNKSNS